MRTVPLLVHTPIRNKDSFRLGMYRDYARNWESALVYSNSARKRVLQINDKRMLHVGECAPLRIQMLDLSEAHDGELFEDLDGKELRLDVGWRSRHRWIRWRMQSCQQNLSKCSSPCLIETRARSDVWLH